VGLGYEGWVKVGENYALGTGMSVPRDRPRLDSSAGYGGQVFTPPDKMGIGLPHNYDYESHDGSLNFEVDMAFYRNVIIDWLFDRQSSKEVLFSTRAGNSQYHESTWLRSINVSASADAALDGSLQFDSIGRSYTYGNFFPYKMGNSPDDPGVNTLLNPDSGFPYQLNPEGHSLVPVPFWNTSIQVNGDDVEFTTWTMSFSQDVVKFFACEHNTSPQTPKYLAVGPMTVVFSGSYINQTFFSDSLDVIRVTVGNPSIDYERLNLKRCAQNTYQDDLQSPDGVTVLDMEYTVYEIERVL
jgi:hypothetical protein